MSGKADNYSDFGLYWGDLHVHSGLSSCFWLWERRGGSLDGIYCFVRDEAKLDFIAVTDHDRMSDKDWVEERVKAKEYNSPGRFVTFLAYEWSSQLPYGGIEDRNIYYLDDDMPIFRGSDWRTNNARRLFSVLEKEGIEAIVIPHHSPKVNTFTDWDQHDSSFQPVVEISSEWGNFEYFRNPHYCKGEDCWPGNFYQDLLKRGLKIGAIASSDSHDNRPSVHKGVMHSVSSERAEGWAGIEQNTNPLAVKLPQIRLEGGWPTNPLTPCYIGVYAEELTREALFEAIRARRVFATAGGRIKVELEVDGHIMGQEYHMEETIPIVIEGKVDGEDKIGKVELIKNNKVILSVMGNSDQVQLNYVDEDISERHNYYYLRASQTNGRMVWSTPVWVTCRDQPDLSVHIRYLSREFPDTKIDRTKELPDSKEKLTILTKKRSSKTKIQVRWKGENAGETCSGELHLKNIQNYLVNMSGFHDAYDLFTDDSSGLVLWNVKLEKGVKGLNIITASTSEEDGSAEIRVLIDEKRMFENVLVNGKRVSTENNWIVQRL